MASSLPPFLSTSVPPIVFTPGGLIVPSDEDILAGVQVDMNTAFGGGLNPALETPQGQLATSEAAVISAKDADFLYFTEQIDPQFSTGRFQDAIARIYFLNRKGATSTVVQANMVGIAGTLIPAGTLAQDTSGNTYILLGDVTIPAGGTGVGSWANIETGPIPCPENTLTTVYQTVPGWDAINNPTDGTLGQNVETASEFETRRKNSVALNSHGTPPSIYAEVFAVDGVLDVFVIDNPTDSIQSGNPLPGGTPNPTNYALAKHSIYVAAIGGADQDIAEAIWRKKDAGCDYNGNTSATVTDPSGYSYPPPSYLVSFERPSSLPIKFSVSIANTPGLPSDIVARVRAAVFARFNGIDGTSRERIGSTILASRYYGAVAAVNNAVQLLSVLVGTVTADSATQPVGIDQGPTLDISDIDVILV